MVKNTLLSLACLWICQIGASQEITPIGKFLQDSIKIGEEIQYSLSVKYPRELQVIFPDSTHDFTPFEYYKKDYFPTRIDSMYVYDSVVYTISSFEIDTIQWLQLPIYLLQGKDSIPIPTTIDSVWLQEMVTVIPDSLSLRENVEFQTITYAFNYPYWILGCGIFIFILILSSFLFGKTIHNKIQLYRLRKRYDKFSIAYDHGVNQAQQNLFPTSDIETVLVIWKKYMERLEKQPFTKYTSKEILAIGYNFQLQEVLQNIDRALYGNINDADFHKNLEILEDFTLERYQHQIKKIQNG